jgi:hypothetical protein
MNRVSESYLANLINDLHAEENALFNPQQNKQLNNDDKLDKMMKQKAKLLSNIKYAAQTLKTHLEKIDYQEKNPKIKAVGI